MNIIFRVDASLEIGTGHMFRCLTLAEELASMGCQCYFISRACPGDLCQKVRDRGFDVIELPALSADRISQELVGHDETPDHYRWLGVSWDTDSTETVGALGELELACCDWVIVDHYAIDFKWERALKTVCRKILVIDDLADRVHECDVLLDQNIGRVESDYYDLVPNYCKLLLGPYYSILRPEFHKLRSGNVSRPSTHLDFHILVAMGGVDNDNITGLVLDALDLCDFPVGTRVTVLLGPHAPNLGAVYESANKITYRTSIEIDSTRVGQIMAESDISIGAAGATTWERCCLGLPTVVLCLAENQRYVVSQLNSRRVSVVTDIADLIADKSVLSDKIEYLRAHLQEYTDNSLLITDGSGSKKVSKIIFQTLDEDHLIGSVEGY